MPLADASGVPIHYDLAGSGPPLVLLHGFVGDSTTWRHAGYVDALTSRFTVILVDARGRGRSGKPHDPAMHGEQHLAGDVLAVLGAVLVTHVTIKPPGQIYDTWSTGRSVSAESPGVSNLLGISSPTVGAVAIVVLLGLLVVVGLLLAAIVRAARSKRRVSA